MSLWTSRAHELRAAQARILATIVQDLDPDSPELETYKTRHIASPAGDERKLRGIPVQAPGIGGTMPGTNPLARTLSNDRWRNDR